MSASADPRRAGPPAPSTDELRQALTEVLTDPARPRGRIARLRRRPTPYCSSRAVEELHVRVEGTSMLRLAFKDLSRSALREEARRARPAFLLDPMREIETYRDVLATESLGTARYHGAAVDAAADRYWLFLEWVPGWNLWQIGDLAVWEQAASWLARLHGRFAGRAEALAGGSRLLRYGPDVYRLWPDRARAFTRGRQGASEGSLERLWRGYDRIIEQLASLPSTLIHGDFYPSNIVVQETATGARVCPLDWEGAAIGPGLMDLAALTAGKWTEEERRRLAEAYRAALAGEGNRPTEPDAFWTALDCCRLHVAVQWLGWSDRWTPPAAHAHDWLREALELAERLGL